MLLIKRKRKEIEKYVTFYLLFIDIYLINQFKKRNLLNSN